MNRWRPFDRLRVSGVSTPILAFPLDGEGIFGGMTALAGARRGGSRTAPTGERIF